MYLIYNDYYQFNNNNSRCYLQIYSPLREVDLDVNLSEYNYWFVYASENYLDKGLSLPVDAKQFLYNLFYNFDIPYNKVITVFHHKKEDFNFAQNVASVVILDDKFPTSKLNYYPVDESDIDYFKTGQPIRYKNTKTLGYEELYKYWSKYIIPTNI